MGDSSIINENLTGRENYVIDVGSGKAFYPKGYLNKVARRNPPIEFIGIDCVYSDSQIEKNIDSKRERIDFRKKLGRYKKGEKPRNLTLIAADAKYLPFRKEISDLTTEFGCIKDNDIQSLREINRITKKGSTVIFGSHWNNFEQHLYNEGFEIKNKKFEYYLKPRPTTFKEDVPIFTYTCEKK